MDILLSLFHYLCLEGESAWEMGACMFTFRTQRSQIVPASALGVKRECGSCAESLFISGDVCIHLYILVDLQWLHCGFNFSWRLMRSISISFLIFTDDYGILLGNTHVPILIPTESYLSKSNLRQSRHGWTHGFLLWLCLIFAFLYVFLNQLGLQISTKIF